MGDKSHHERGKYVFYIGDEGQNPSRDREISLSSHIEKIK